MKVWAVFNEVLCKRFMIYLHGTRDRKSHLQIQYPMMITSLLCQFFTTPLLYPPWSGFTPNIPSTWVPLYYKCTTVSISAPNTCLCHYVPGKDWKTLEDDDNRCRNARSEFWLWQFLILSYSTPVHNGVFNTTSKRHHVPSMKCNMKVQAQIPNKLGRCVKCK